MTAARAALRATQVLHCNLNVVDEERAATCYERGLGLTTRMRSEPSETDSSMLGIEGSTHSSVRFLYDHRGGRVSPAVELVEWRRPPTVGSAYADPTAVGMQALWFTTPSVATTRDQLSTVGATPVETVGGSVPVEAELLDPDGVRIELTEDPATPGPTFAGLRISCADLDASVAWYGELGWERVGPHTTSRRASDAPAATTQRLVLATHPFELLLTEWEGTDRSQRAHTTGNARGLFRMALAVDDVRVAHAEAAATRAVEVGEPQYVPLPGTPLGGVWVSFLRDPNGVTVELAERVMPRGAPARP